MKVASHIIHIIDMLYIPYRFPIDSPNISWISHWAFRKFAHHRLSAALMPLFTKECKQSKRKAFEAQVPTF